MIGDLHCHTTFSDGSLKMSELISVAEGLKLDYIAITDHDSIKGIEKIRNLKSESPVKIIAGTEISSYDYKNNKKVHILCYNPKYPEKLKEVCEKTTASRREAGMFYLEKIKEKYAIAQSQIEEYSRDSGCVFKQHIMHALASAGYCSKIFDDLFYELFSGNGCNRLSYSIKYPDVLDVIDVIKSAKGVSVIAHAGGYNNFDVIDDLIERGLDGIEVFHPRNTAEHRARLAFLAQENSLIKTGGTDFHGLYSLNPMPLGSCYTQQEEIFKILNKD